MHQKINNEICLGSKLEKLIIILKLKILFKISVFLES